MTTAQTRDRIIKWLSTASRSQVQGAIGEVTDELIDSESWGELADLITEVMGPELDDDCFQLEGEPPPEPI